jgi:hypothetical protein
MRMVKDEILLVLIVLSALVAGAAAKHYRQTHPHVKPAGEPAGAETNVRAGVGKKTEK